MLAQQAYTLPGERTGRVLWQSRRSQCSCYVVLRQPLYACWQWSSELCQATKPSSSVLSLLPCHEAVAKYRALHSHEASYCGGHQNAAGLSPTNAMKFADTLVLTGTPSAGRACTNRLASPDGCMWAYGAHVVTWPAGSSQGVRVSSLPCSCMEAHSLEWGACSREDGLCHILAQGGDAWQLESAPAQATHLSDQLTALHTDAARQLLNDPATVLSWSCTQGSVAFRRPYSHTDPGSEALSGSPCDAAGDDEVYASCGITHLCAKCMA